MKLDALTRLLGSKRKQAHDLEMTTAALAEVDQELERARQALADAEAAHDSGVVEAVAANDDATLTRLREAVENARRRVELLQVTRAAVERRHQAAQEAQEARRLARQWESAREACDARRAALVRLEAALDDAAAAIRDANAAFALMIERLPSRLSTFPDGYTAHELATLVLMQLCAETNGAIRSSMPLSPYELAKQPRMVARHDAGVPLVFAAAPVTAAAKET